MKTTSSYSILCIFYLVVLFSTTFLFTSCDLNNERVGGFPPEGHIWVEIENTDYTFPEPSGTSAALLNTYSTMVQSLSIYRSTSFNDVKTGNFRVLLTRFNFDDTTPRKLDNTNVRLDFYQGNLVYSGIGDDLQFEILSIENDVIKANFSGTLTKTDNPNQQIRVRNGALHIKIRRE